MKIRIKTTELLRIVDKVVLNIQNARLRYFNKAVDEIASTKRFMSSKPKYTIDEARKLVSISNRNSYGNRYRDQLKKLLSLRRFLTRMDNHAEYVELDWEDLGVLGFGVSETLDGIFFFDTKTDSFYGEGKNSVEEVLRKLNK